MLKAQNKGFEGFGKRGKSPKTPGNKVALSPANSDHGVDSPATKKPNFHSGNWALLWFKLAITTDPLGCAGRFGPTAPRLKIRWFLPWL